MTLPSPKSPSQSPGGREEMGMLFAISGEYEDYRARPCEVYASVEVGEAEATRRNALVAVARERVRVLWDEPDDQWASTDRKMKRVINKLRRETSDPDIESHDVGDLKYQITPVRLIP